jgi:hypothetical protein
MTDAECLRALNEHLEVASVLKVDLEQRGWTVELHRTCVAGWPFVSWPLKAKAARVEKL